LLYKTFRYKSRITKNNKINIGKIGVIKEIIKHTELGCLRWQVPSFVREMGPKIKAKFIRGYFDGDGTCSNRIRFFSVNVSGLKQVSSILDDLDVNHTFQGPFFKTNRKPSYIIQISEKKREMFLKLIQPISKKPGLRG
jgi:intein/homing endonuclease